MAALHSCALHGDDFSLLPSLFSLLSLPSPLFSLLRDTYSGHMSCHSSFVHISKVNLSIILSSGGPLRRRLRSVGAAMILTSCCFSSLRICFDLWSALYWPCILFPLLATISLALVIMQPLPVETVTIAIPQTPQTQLYMRLCSISAAIVPPTLY